MPSPLIVLTLIAAALLLAVYRARRLIGAIARAPAAHRWDKPWQRLGFVVRDVGLHRRLLQIRLSGTFHAMIFCGFIVLLSAIVADFGAGLFPGFSLRPIGGDTWVALLQDVFAIVVLVAIALAAWHRFVMRPARFAGSRSADATVIYVLVICVVGSMLAEFACAVVGGADARAWRPVSWVLAQLLIAAGMSVETAGRVRVGAYWVHILSVLGFLAYIPGSKHRHIFAAIPNIFFRPLTGNGVLPAPPPERGQIGISRIDQFSWKDMLDVASCTECGRCQAACPAYVAGLPLSPKRLIMDLRDSVLTGAAGPLLGGTIGEQTLWACTTCRACMTVCPIHIEHVPKIVEMRRQLVEEARVSPGLQDAFANVQRTGNSMGKPARQRARWTKDLAFKVKDARKEPVDVLWFVGDYASFDPRAQRITIAFAKLLHAAGVDFGILSDAEQNSGNDVRRAGEEGLFQTLARSNMDVLEACTFQRIVTTDPHSLNALRQEYPMLGAAVVPVLHHTDLLLELLNSGALRVKPGDGAIVTYHDPCYLGRYNGGFGAPRALIERAGYRLHEMPRNRENSFCCGAGGGRIWGDDTGVTERPSENRIREALALGDATLFVVACPKDMVMYTAAIEALDVRDKLAVRDIVDLLHVEDMAPV